ncbi:hypothetical protein GCM10023238_03050 [Streptomyces heliomycini]
MEWAGRAEDTACRPRCTCGSPTPSSTSATPRRPRCHRGTAERMLAEEALEEDSEPEHGANACEIRSSSAENEAMKG